MLNYIQNDFNYTSNIDFIWTFQEKFTTTLDDSSRSKLIVFEKLFDLDFTTLNFIFSCL